MTKPNTTPKAWASMALRAFLFRTFTRLAVQAEKDSKAFRSVLRGLM